MLFLFTAFLSNAVVAIILTPISLLIAEGIGCDPRPFLMAICFGASACFMTPMGYQTNLMVFGPGQYKMKDFVYIGLPLNLIFWGLAIYLIPIFWEFNPTDLELDNQENIIEYTLSEKDIENS